MKRASAAWSEPVARWLVRYRWPLFAASLLISVCCGWLAASGLKIDPSAEALVESDSPARAALHELRVEFGNDNTALLVVQGDVYTTEYLERLAKLEADVGALDTVLPSLGAARLKYQRGPPERSGQEVDPAVEDDWGELEWGDTTGASVIEQTTSLLSAVKISSNSATLSIRDYSEVLQEVGLVGFRQAVEADTKLAGRLVDKAGTLSLVAIENDFLDTTDTRALALELQRLAAAHSTEGFRVSVAGLPALAVSLERLMQKDLSLLMAIMHLLLIVVLGVLFRSVLGVFGPLLVVAQANIWAFGVVGAWGREMTILANAVPMLLVCVGLADAVHVQTTFFRLRREGQKPTNALVAALSHTLRPLLLTSATTAAGMASFAFATLDSVRDFGLFAAVGVVAALGSSLAVLPAMLSVSRHVPRAEASRPPVRRLLAWLAPGAAQGSRRLKLAALIVAPLLLVAVAGVGQLRVKHDALSWLPEDEPVRTTIERIDATIGGSSTISLLIDSGRRGGATDAAFLERLGLLEADLVNYRRAPGRPMVASSYSILDPVREAWAALKGPPQGATLPPTDRGVTDTITLLSSSDEANLDRVLSFDRRQASMILHVPWLEAGAYAGFAEFIERQAQARFEDLARVQPTGTTHYQLSAFNAIVKDLLTSFSAAFIMISGLMLVALRRVKLALVAMIPNLLPVAVMLGIMGYAGIGLDMNTLLLGAIALGIVVDDTVYLLINYTRQRRLGQGSTAAMHAALVETGPAMISTTCLLAVGFGVFLFAELGNIRTFGVVVGGTVAIALLVDLTIAPLTVMWADRAKDEKKQVAAVAAPGKAGGAV